MKFCMVFHHIMKNIVVFFVVVFFCLRPAENKTREHGLLFFRQIPGMVA